MRMESVSPPTCDVNVLDHVPEKQSLRDGYGFTQFIEREIFKKTLMEGMEQNKEGESAKQE